MRRPGSGSARYSMRWRRGLSSCEEINRSRGAGKNRRKPMSTRFSGKTVLVAGGTGGLGRAVSLAFLAEEAAVGVTYRRPEEFDALKSAGGANGSRLEGHRVDVTDEAAVSSLIETVLARHGRL